MLCDSNSRDFHLSGENNKTVDTEPGYQAEVLNFFLAYRPDAPVNQHFEELKANYGELIAIAALGGGYDCHIRKALHLESQSIEALKKATHGNCFDYEPVLDDLPNTGANEPQKNLYEFKLTEHTIPPILPSFNADEWFQFWLEKERQFPSLWGLIGYADLQQLKQSLGQKIDYFLIDPPLLTRLRKPRCIWLHIQGSGFINQADGNNTSTLIQSLTETVHKKNIEDDLSAHFVSPGLFSGQTSIRFLLFLGFLFKKTLPVIVVFSIVVAICLLLVENITGWNIGAIITETDSFFKLHQNDAHDIFSFFPWFLNILVSGGLIQKIPILGLLLLIPCLVANSRIFPPYLRVSFPLESLESVHKWFENKVFRSGNRNTRWWLDWRGREWLAMTVFGRSLFFPWQRNDWVVLVWEQVENMEQPDQEFLEFLFQQARHHNSRLLVIINLYDRGLIPLCARAINNTQGQSQKYLLADLSNEQFESTGTASDESGGDLLNMIATHIYGNSDIDKGQLESRITVPEFINWRDAPLMATLASSQKMPIRFAINISQIKADENYQRASGQKSPLDLIRPTFSEFWAWLYSASGSSDIQGWDC